MRPALPISYEHTENSYHWAEVSSPTRGDKTELLESPGVSEKEGALPPERVSAETQAAPFVWSA